MTVRVLVSDSLSQGGLEIMARTPGIDLDYKPGVSEGELAAAIGGYEGLVIRSGSKVTAQVIDGAHRLRVIGRAGIGVDNVDVPAASRRGIVVMNTPTGNAVTAAEHALSLLFAVARKIGQADATMKQGKWEKKLGGRELSGKTLGILGLGNIGRIVADRAQGLRMHVIACDPVVTAARAAELGIELVTFDELLRRADAITIHTPLTPETRNIVNDAAIEKMKTGVTLINAAHGGVCDEDAVLRGLETGKVGGAGLDVFAKEPPGLTDLIRHPSVVATPHLGASTEEAQERVALEICEQVVAYLTTGTISNAVNVPSVPSEMASVLSPYTTLARRLGQFISAVELANAKSILVECGGEAAALPTGPVVNAALAGLLAGFFESPVNEVNAPVLAKDRGIEVRELRTPQAGAFASMLTLTLTGADGQQAVVGGTLGSDRSAHLVRWGCCEMDALLAGPVLVMKNADRPGVIGTIGTILGENDINVSRMQMGLDSRVGEAASVWALDSALTPDALARIRHARDVRVAFGVVLT